jgi:methyl coenzyme M reductase gamma subunit
VAAKQTRRSISVRGTTYENLRRYCLEQDISMSEVVEEQIARLLSRPSAAGRPAPVPYEKVVAPRVARRDKDDYRAIRF